MNKAILLFALLLLPASLVASADDQNEQVFNLKDGSQIKGVLSGVENGVYTVKTPIIGDVHVAANDVASITSSTGATTAPAPALPANNTAAAPATLPSNMDQQMASTQQKLMSNPQSMAIIQQIAQDPEISEALRDPAVVQAVMSHDYQAVQSNPKIQALMSNPKMQEFLKQLASQQQQ